VFFDHEPRRLALDRIEYESLIDAHRASDVEHDARAPLHHQAEAERLDEPAAALARLGGQAEHELRHIDDHPVRIGEREGGKVDAAGKVDDESCARLVAHESRFADDGIIFRRSPRGDAIEGRARQNAGGEERPAERGEQALMCAKTHRFLTSLFLLLQ